MRIVLPLSRSLCAVAVAALAGCAHGALIANGTPAPVPVGKVASIRVHANASLADRPAYQALDCGERISQALVAELTDRGLYDRAGALQLDVFVDAIRLRSTGNAFWNGLFAGEDKLEGGVLIREGAGPAAKYSFKYAGAEDFWLKFGATARFDSMAEELAEQVADLLGDANDRSRG